MKTILARLEEMPLSMIVRVARKFKLDIRVDEPKEKIINRLEDVISNYLLDIDEESDIYVDAGLAKYDLLADMEVPHEVIFEKYNHADKVQNFVTYIDMLLIDDMWSYLYWDLSQHDFDRIRRSTDFSGLEAQVLYKKSPFSDDFFTYDEKDSFRITLNDIDRNFYQQCHHMYAIALLVACFSKGKQLLAVSGEVFIPHSTPIWERSEISMREYKILDLSLGKHHKSVPHIKLPSKDFLKNDNEGSVG